MSAVSETSMRWDGFSWLQPTADSVPAAIDVENAGLGLGPLETAAVQVVRRGQGKHHTVSDREWGVCRYAGAAGTGTEIGLLQLSSIEVCRHCVSHLLTQLPETIYTYLTVVTWIVNAQRWTRALSAAAPRLGWLGWARWTHANPFARDEPFRDVLAKVTGRGAPILRRQALTVWANLSDQAQTALAEAAQAAGPPGLAVHAAHAKALLNRDTRIQRESALITRISNDNPYHPARPPLWALASHAWEQATTSGASLDAARATMLLAAQQAYADAEVRDVSLLPDPVLDGTQFCGPAHWANAEFAELRRRLVRSWADELERSLLEAELSAREDTPALLVLTHWPPLADTDAELAYLVQYPTLLTFAAAPSHIRLTARPWTRERNDNAVPAVVLRVPAFAAQHAEAAARATGRYATRAELTVDPADESTTTRAAIEAARPVALYLPADAEADPDTTATQLVRQHRAQYSHPTIGLHYQGDRDLTAELTLRWVNGWHAWIPDDPGRTPQPVGLGTPEGLRLLLEHSYHREVTAIIETGARPDTELIQITGTIDTITDHEITMLVSADKAMTLPIPLHRFVSIQTT